jgi:uncharacterized protein (TIGR02452 family)
MSRESRAALARETVAILEAGGYQFGDGTTVDLAERLRECVFETVLYEPEALEGLMEEARALGPGEMATAISVHNETTLQGAQALGQEGHGKIGVLNFASAKNPGGGFLNGSQAQEESLARSSALHASLMTAPGYYDYHRSRNDPLYSHRAILSPGCPIFRDDDGTPLREPLLLVDFITCPAPNAGAVKQNKPESTDLIPGTLRQRAAYVLALALHKRCDALVLGAWGCGVFQNDPRMVAEAFAGLLNGKTFAGRFKSVRFSVLDARGGTFEAFQQILG